MVKIGTGIGACSALVVNFGMDILAKDVGAVRLGA